MFAFASGTYNYIRALKCQEDRVVPSCYIAFVALVLGLISVGATLIVPSFH